MSIISFRGLDNVLAMFEKLDADKVEKGLEKACLIVEREARKKAPKGRTGDLANSITHKVENLEGIVYTPLFYAPYVEYGTGAFREENPEDGYWIYVPEDKGGGKVKAKASRRYTLEEAQEIVASMRAEGIEAEYTNGMPPRPYMRPALDENREEVLKTIAGALLE